MTRELSDMEIYALNQITVVSDEVLMLLDHLNNIRIHPDSQWIEKAKHHFEFAFNALKYSIEKPDLTEGDE